MALRLPPGLAVTGEFLRALFGVLRLPLHLQDLTMALCSNDARRCYDRIVHSVAAMAIRRFGVTKNTAQAMFQTIQNIRHHVRTAFGDSELFQCPSSSTDVVHGIGQGNGAGPAIWLAISSVMFDVLRNEGYGLDIAGPISDEHLRMAGFAFVDDTDLIQDATTNDPRRVTENIQQSLDLWEAVLRATGGALVPNKSFWYLVDYKFNSRGDW